MSPGKVNYYILIASNLKTTEGVIPAPEFVHELARDGYWLLGQRSSFRRQIEEGDQAVLYAAGGHSVFLATVTIAGNPRPLSYREQETLRPDVAFMFATPYHLELTDLALFEKPVPARELLHDLSFITNKEKWGGHFQGGARRIPQEDFDLIVARGM